MPAGTHATKIVDGIIESRFIYSFFCCKKPILMDRLFQKQCLTLICLGQHKPSAVVISSVCGVVPLFSEASSIVVFGFLLNDKRPAPSKSRFLFNFRTPDRADAQRPENKHSLVHLDLISTLGGGGRLWKVIPHRPRSVDVKKGENCLGSFWFVSSARTHPAGVLSPTSLDLRRRFRTDL